jgi:hypothetical protein
MIIFITAKLQGPVSCVHRQKESHQQDFGDQNVVRITPGPSIEIMASEPSKFENISADKKNYAGKKYKDSQDFESVDQKGVEATQGICKQTVFAQATIQDNFKHFNVDDDEACIDKEVHHRHKWVSKHFLLTECEQQYIFPSFTSMITVIFLVPQQDVPPDFSSVSCKKQNGANHEQDEYDLLDDLHQGVITHLR